ncbi:MAG: nucleic acid/nucleotide deaminase domain-containing protein [Pseudomonadota bacterium]
MAYFSPEDHAAVSQLDLVAVAILYEADDKIRETFASGQLRGLNAPTPDRHDNPRMDQATDRCVAVAVVGSELYVGTNGLAITKELRDSVRGHGAKPVSGTTVKNINAGHAIAADSQDLHNFRQEITDGLGRILGYSKVNFLVGTATYLNNYHAEMQLLDWFIRNEIKPNDRYFGVSKPCCPECTEVLAKAGVLHTSSHDKNAHVRTNVIEHAKTEPSFGGAGLHPHLSAEELNRFRTWIS